MNIPALTYKSVSDLIKQVARYQPALKTLSDAPPQLASVFTPVAVLSWLIAKYAPQMREKPTLRVLIAGAELGDTAIEGMGYGMLPGMIASKATLQVDLVGDELSDDSTPFEMLGTRMPAMKTPFGPMLRGAYPGLRPRYTVGKVSQLMAEHPEHRWDVAIVASPGMEMHAASWMAPGEFEAVVERSDVVFLCAYTAYDRLFDHLALQAFGFGDAEMIPDCPYSMKVDAVSAMYGFPSRIGKRTSPAREGALNQVDRYGQATMQIPKYNGMDELLRPIGSRLPKVQREVFALLGDLVVEPDANAVLLLVDGDLLDFAVYDAAAPEAQLPPADGPHLLLLEWAVTVCAAMEINESGREILDITNRAMHDNVALDAMQGGKPKVSTLGEILASANMSVSEDADESGMPEWLEGGLETLLGAGATKRFFGAVPTDMTPGEKLLMEAVAKNDIEGVSSQLDQGARAEFADAEGWTPLMEGSRRGNTEIVALLLSRGGKPNTANRFGWTPVIYAAHEAHWPALRALLHRGGDPDKENLAGHSAGGFAKTLNADYETRQLIIQSRR